MMNAFFDNIGQVQHGEQSGSQSRHPPIEEQTDAQDYEEEDAVGAFPQWCNAVTTQVGNLEESLTGEKPKDMPPKKKGDVPGKCLTYVDIKVNGKAIRAMVDIGPTHNYIYSTEVERLGLTLKIGYRRMKAINSAAQLVVEISRSVLIKIGSYEGKTNFSIVIMDDFKLILRLEFLRDTKTTVMPCTNSLAMLGSKPCVILTISPREGERSISALQLKKGLKRDETTYLAMLRVDNRVAINIGKKIRKALTRNPVAQQLLKLIESDKTRQFWQEDGLLITKGRRETQPIAASKWLKATFQTPYKLQYGEAGVLKHALMAVQVLLSWPVSWGLEINGIDISMRNELKIVLMEMALSLIGNKGLQSLILHAEKRSSYLCSMDKEEQVLQGDCNVGVFDPCYKHIIWLTAWKVKAVYANLATKEEGAYKWRVENERLRPGDVAALAQFCFTVISSLSKPLKCISNSFSDSSVLSAAAPIEKSVKLVTHDSEGTYWIMVTMDPRLKIARSECMGKLFGCVSGKGLAE
ncbi:hypothetical protein RJ639_047123 [Escallonia herrerae]|uniref:Uncharacterized protein n=1 Tax=Escallonia herrerae TaxID=1293975 RepID=A0AA88W5V6_9ASTE|nr:hypothetical protein RJ639_047123 [Escallonia herrerae]